MPSNRRDLLVRIDTQFQGGGFKSAEQSAKVLERELNKAELAERNMANLQMAAAREAEARRAKQLAGYRQVGTAATLMGAAIAAGLAISGKAAMDWETAWAGVTKTVNGSAAEMDELEGQLRSLARTLPASHEEIAAVAEAAGQLGVRRQDIARFTKTMIDLGVSTNLSSDEAATGLARLGNVMGVLPSQVDRAGAALVALGNDGASTEADILEMSLRIAGAGRTIGLTEAQVMGFANALSSVGIEAEAGGSAISRVFVDIAQAADKGGDKLTVMARLAGMTATQFKQSFQRDAAGAVVAVIEGLGKLNKTGQSSFDVLDELGWSNIRVRDTMLRASQAGDMLRASVDLGSKSWEQNTALVNEANKRYETSASRIKIARNNLTDAAIDIGAVVLPAFAAIGDRVGFLANTFRELPEPVKQAVAILGSVASAALLVGGASLLLIPKLATMNATLAASGPAGAAAARGLSAATSAMAGPWGLAIAGATVALGVWMNQQYKAKERAHELAQTLDDQTGAITDNSRAFARDALFKDGTLEAAKALGISLEDVTNAALGQSDALERVNTQLAAGRELQISMGSSGQGLAGVAGEMARNLDKVSASIDGGNKDMANARKEIALKTEAMGTDSKATSDAAKTNQNLAGVLDGLSGSADEAQKQLDELLKAVEDFGSGTLDAHAAARDYQQAVDDATKSIKDNGKAVNRARTEFTLTTEAGRKNQSALEGMATAALKSATANFQNGDSVKKITTQVMKARDEFVAMAIKMGLNRTAANKLADQLGLTKSNVATLNDAIKNTPTSHNTNMTVQTKAALAALTALQRHINGLRGNDIRVGVRYVDLNKNPTSKAGGITQADGGVVDFYGNGGIHEDHRAQIVPPGTYRMFGELETGGEGYIPLAPSKRPSAIPVWEEVGRRLGVLERVPMGALAAPQGQAGQSGPGEFVGKLFLDSGEFLGMVRGEVTSANDRQAREIKRGRR